MEFIPTGRDVAILLPLPHRRCRLASFSFVSTFHFQLWPLDSPFALVRLLEDFHAATALRQSPGPFFPGDPFGFSRACAREMELAGKAQKPSGLPQGLVRHSAPSRDGWIYQGARCALFLLSQRCRRQTAQ